MKIELRGVEFVNKGAELMLHSIINKLTEEIDDVEFVMEASGRAPYQKLRTLGISLTTTWWKRGYNILFFTRYLPQFLLSPFHIVKSKNIDIVLDGSGFAFGDQWGAEKAGKRAANHIDRWKKEGKKVILLPQAFGPFEDRLLLQKMKVILDHADMIYARDGMSFDFLKSIGDYSNVKLSPDFTNILTPWFYDPKFNRTVWVIPNSKMISATKREDGFLYKSLILKSIQYLQNQEMDVKFLIHEAGGHDEKLASEINKKNSNPIEMIVELDPIKVKALIGSGYAVISSRFHGLVSALSQGIPCLATGWSHKYQMLLLDYNYSDNLLKLDIKEDDLNKRLDSISKNSFNQKARVHLNEKAKYQKDLVSKMWEEVISIIKS